MNNNAISYCIESLRSETRQVILSDLKHSLLISRDSSNLLLFLVSTIDVQFQTVLTYSLLRQIRSRLLTSQSYYTVSLFRLQNMTGEI